MATPPQGKKPAPRKAPPQPAASTRKAAGRAAPAPAAPTSYRGEFADWARKLATLGATDKELAEAFEVAQSTLHLWKKEFPEFSESIKRGKAIADAEVACKLFHRATGYEHPEDDIRSVNGEIVVTPTVKRYPPDTTAAIFWLKNRRPDLWRDKVESAVAGAAGGPLRARIAVEHVQPLPRVGDDDA